MFHSYFDKCVLSSDDPHVIAIDAPSVPPQIRRGGIFVHTVVNCDYIVDYSFNSNYVYNIHSICRP